MIPPPPQPPMEVHQINTQVDVNDLLNKLMFAGIIQKKDESKPEEKVMGMEEDIKGSETNEKEV